MGALVVGSTAMWGCGADQRTDVAEAHVGEEAEEMGGIASLGMGTDRCDIHARPDPSIWEDEVGAFERRDEVAPPPPSPVVFIGSSSITRWESLAEDMAPLQTVNNGFGGSTLSDLLFFFERLVTSYDPLAVVIYAGENDLAARDPLPAACVSSDFEDLIVGLREIGMNAPLFFVSLKPSPSRAELLGEMNRVNSHVQAHADRTAGVTYVDVMTPMLDGSGRPRAELFEADGLHINAAGYAIWTETLRPHLLGVQPR